MSKACMGCGREVEPYLNFCSWECHIDLTKREGGRVHCPNGLPIRCITRDGLMLECEHGDHRDYKFPVVAEYVGKLDDDELEELEKVFGHPFTEQEARESRTEVHALIYTDGYIALTLYECTYALWSLADGRVRAGQMWKPSDWRLNLVSITQIKELATREGRCAC